MTLPEQIPVLVDAGVAGGRATDAAQSPLSTLDTADFLRGLSSWKRNP